MTVVAHWAVMHTLNRLLEAVRSIIENALLQCLIFSVLITSTSKSIFLSLNAFIPNRVAVLTSPLVLFRAIPPGSCISSTTTLELSFSSKDVFVSAPASCLPPIDPTTIQCCPPGIVSAAFEPTSLDHSI